MDSACQTCTSSWMSRSGRLSSSTRLEKKMLCIQQNDRKSVANPERSTTLTLDNWTPLFR